MLRLAALPLAIDDIEVDFDRMTNRCVSVGRHLHKQHTLQDTTVLWATKLEAEEFKDQSHLEVNTHWLTLIFVYCRFHFPDLLPI